MRSSLTHRAPSAPLAPFQSVAATPLPSVFRLFALSVALGSLLLLSGCARNPSANNQADVRELNVAAAANLTDAFTELGQRFTAQTNVRVVYSFGATADLAKQIENGAPFDLFAAADVEHVDELNGKGLLVAGTAQVYARGRLVLWVPPDSRARIERLEDLTDPSIERIAVAKPDVAPYGRATIEALRALKLWPELEPKVIYGQNVSQVRQYAATGNVDVAFIPRALFRVGEGRAIDVDERLHQPLNQSLAVIRASPRQEAAQRFARFVLSDEGRALLERYGYHRPQ